MKRITNTEVRSPAERHVAMSWAQRLKRVFNIDIEVCTRCGGSVKVIACIEDQDIINRILAHLREKDHDIPTLPLLTPPPRAPPETLPLFIGKESEFTEFISRAVTKKRLAWIPTRPSAGMTAIDLRQGRYERDFAIINDARTPSSGMRPGGCESIFCQ